MRAMRSRSRRFLVAAFAVMLTGCQQHSRIAPIAEQPVIKVVDPENARPVQFSRIVIDLKRGAQIGTFRQGVGFCSERGTLVYRGGRMHVDDRELSGVFRDELERANYKVVGDPDALFDDPSSWQAEFLIAGLVKRIDADLCYAYNEFEKVTKTSGVLLMDVDWQVYSRLDRNVVYREQTEGRGEIKELSTSGETDLVLDAFAQATRNLLADRRFYEIVGQGGAPVQRPTSEVGMNLVSRQLFTQPITANMAAVRNNVVVVYGGGGHGSGFVIDDSGRVLTNEHVVRTAARVGVRFESGDEATATVLATDPRRDVALLRLDRSGTGGLPIRFDQPAVGDTVYAVGAPLDPAYSATVSKGIISAFRDIEGESWIQSDVNVQHGSSGGPLLDERGNILGITARGEPNEAGTPSGVNLFVPILDALRRLGLNPKAATS
jgi:S1-C subfamily serine protease